MASPYNLIYLLCLPTCTWCKLHAHLGCKIHDNLGGFRFQLDIGVSNWRSGDESDDLKKKLENLSSRREVHIMGYDFGLVREFFFVFCFG